LIIADNANASIFASRRYSGKRI